MIQFFAKIIKSLALISDLREGQIRIEARLDMICERLAKLEARASE
jgi:hypothetical protein